MHMFCTILSSLALAIPSNFSDSKQAGEVYIQSYSSVPSDYDSATQISLAISSKALSIDTSKWDIFTHIDFIVSSSSTDSIRANGTSNTSSDIKGTYSREENVQPYVATSIPFSYFSQNIKRAKAVSTPKAKDELFINYIIGTGNCPAKKIGACQNGELRRDYSYMYCFFLFSYFYC